MICECYRNEKNFVGGVGTCCGTAERDACSCGGDKSKCDFCPNVRKEKKAVTNYDRTVSKSPEELKEWFCNAHPNTCSGCPFDGIECTMLDWLKQEAKE